MRTKFAIPHKIAKITLKEKSEESSRAQIGDGFEAGYQAGKWQAALEQKKWIEVQKNELQKNLQTLQEIKTQTNDLIAAEFPGLLHLLLEKVLKKNPFTVKQIAEEIQVFLRELNEAHSVRIECAPSDLKSIQETCEKMNLNFGQGGLQWKTNPDLQSGEYRIQSDLGSVDGRLQARLAKLNLSPL